MTDTGQTSLFADAPEVEAVMEAVREIPCSRWNACYYANRAKQAALDIATKGGK